MRCLLQHRNRPERTIWNRMPCCICPRTTEPSLQGECCPSPRWLKPLSGPWQEWQWEGQDSGRWTGENVGGNSNGACPTALNVNKVNSTVNASRGLGQHPTSRVAPKVSSGGLDWDGLVPDTGHPVGPHTTGGRGNDEVWIVHGQGELQRAPRWACLSLPANVEAPRNLCRGASPKHHDGGSATSTEGILSHADRREAQLQEDPIQVVYLDRGH